MTWDYRLQVFVAFPVSGIRCRLHRLMVPSRPQWRKKTDISGSDNQLRVRTHQQSRVQSSPIRLTRTGQWLCGFITIATAAVRTHQQSLVGSHESSRVKSLDVACFIFITLQRSGVPEEMQVKKPILLVKVPEAIYAVSRCEHWNRVLLWWWYS
jgi:hypothetical protein